MKTTSEILNLLKSYKSIATSKYGLTKIGIFGSVARENRLTRVMLTFVTKARLLLS